MNVKDVRTVLPSLLPDTGQRVFLFVFLLLFCLFVVAVVAFNLCKRQRWWLEVAAVEDGPLSRVGHVNSMTP